MSYSQEFLNVKWTYKEEDSKTSCNKSFCVFFNSNVEFEKSNLFWILGFKHTSNFT
jgi:hypothetical protein